MTLTTERQQFEEWFTNKYPRSYWGVEKTASGEYQGGLAAPLWEAWKESRGCMANREAQPVAANAQIAGYFVRQRPEWDKRAPWTPWKEVDAASYDNIVKIIATGEAYCGWFYDTRILYDAPPAPAVPDDVRRDAERWRAMLGSARIRILGIAGFDAPVPHGGDPDYRHFGMEIWTHYPGWMAEKNEYGIDTLTQYADACRAAMLAQPVSSGYKLPEGFKLVPVESTDAWAERYCELTNKHPDGGLTTYIGDGAVTITFREKSKREIDAMLAAAPEGGNDHDTRR